MNHMAEPMKKIIAVLMVLLASSVYAEKVVVVPMFEEVEAANWSGDWASDTEYKVDDIIQYDGSSYIADHTSDLSNYPPDATYWQLVAASGATGAAATVDVGTTTTGAATSTAMVINSGTCRSKCTDSSLLELSISFLSRPIAVPVS